MNYEDHEARTCNVLEQSFGKKFLAHTDIANCFGSIYTHSLEWAIQGYETAKRNRHVKPEHWSTTLDTAFRNVKRCETSGLPIGPAASNIGVEIILSSIDEALTEQGYTFARYIDDYVAFCDSHEEAQNFILHLGNALASYRLSLNLSKTTIEELPEPLQDSWVSLLNNSVPSRTNSEGVLTLSTAEAINFLDYAVRLNKETPDGSVLKYAINSIAHRASDITAVAIFNYTLNLSWHYPALLPLLEKIDARSEYYDYDATGEKLNKIISINAMHRRSDGMCWALYYLKQLGLEPGELQVSQIIESKDCAAIAMLCKFTSSLPSARDYAAMITNNAHLYELDQNWLLLYELFLQDLIENPYPSEATFEILKRHNVSFIYPDDRLSIAEQYCHVLFNPFRGTEEVPTFAQWITANSPPPAPLPPPQAIQIPG